MSTNPLAQVDGTVVSLNHKTVVLRRGGGLAEYALGFDFPDRQRHHLRPGQSIRLLITTRGTVVDALASNETWEGRHK